MDGGKNTNDDKKLVSSPGSKAPDANTMKKLQDLLQLLNAGGDAGSMGNIPQAKEMEEYKFWKTQPVRKFNDEVNQEGPIENKTIEQVSKSLTPLHRDFDWSNINIDNADEMTEVFDLLYHNYIEDLDSTFRFNYSPEFLHWALKPPGWNADWHLGVRAKATGKLVAFISGIPAQIRVRENPVIQGAEINFLCVHKKLRSKRLAPLLIKEITRRINLTGVWQALYSAGIILPSPVSKSRYYHRSINWKTLYDVGFTYLPSGKTASQMVAKYSLPNTPTIPNFRPMTLADVDQVFELFNNYMSKFDMAQVFSKDEIKHWLVNQAADPKDQVIFSYVITDEKDSTKVTDFASFYRLESTVLEHDKHTNLKVAYGFYYATSQEYSAVKEQLTTRLKLLMNNLLIMASSFKFDVFNALSHLDNPLFLEDLKFGAGDGYLNYYLFNYNAFPVHGGLDETSTTGEIKLELPEKGGLGVVML